MCVSIDTLEMTASERAACKDRVREMAYYLWLDWGRPDGRELDCWLAAERRWMEHDYVPRRPLDGTRPTDRHIPASQTAEALAPA